MVTHGSDLITSRSFTEKHEMPNMMGCELKVFACYFLQCSEGISIMSRFQIFGKRDETLQTSMFQPTTLRDFRDTSRMRYSLRYTRSSWHLWPIYPPWYLEMLGIFFALAFSHLQMQLGVGISLISPKIARALSLHVSLNVSTRDRMTVLNPSRMLMTCCFSHYTSTRRGKTHINPQGPFWMVSWCIIIVIIIVIMILSWFIIFLIMIYHDFIMNYHSFGGNHSNYSLGCIGPGLTLVSCFGRWGRHGTSKRVGWSTNGSLPAKNAGINVLNSLSRGKLSTWLI